MNRVRIHKALIAHVIINPTIIRLWPRRPLRLLVYIYILNVAFVRSVTCAFCHLFFVSVSYYHLFSSAYFFHTEIRYRVNNLLYLCYNTVNTTQIFYVYRWQTAWSCIPTYTGKIMLWIDRSVNKYHWNWLCCFPVLL